MKRLGVLTLAVGLTLSGIAFAAEQNQSIPGGDSLIVKCDGKRLATTRLSSVEVALDCIASATTTTTTTTRPATTSSTTTTTTAPARFAVTATATRDSGTAAHVDAVGTGGVVNVVVNEAGRKVAEGLVDSSGKARIPFATDGAAHTYQVVGWNSLPGQPGTATTPVSVSIPGTVTPPPVTSTFELGFSEGWNTGPDPARSFREMRALGATWIRLDMQDKAIHEAELAKAAGLKVLVIGPYTTDPAQYRAEVSAFLPRLGANVDAWEMTNEPNGGVGGAFTPQSHAALVRPAYETVKSIRDIPFIVGAYATGSNHAVLFMEEIYRQGLQAYFDAVSMHPYNFNVPLPALSRDERDHPYWNGYGIMFSPQLSGSPPAYRTGGPGQTVNQPGGMTPWLRLVMDRNGDAAKPLWASEIGVPNDGRSNPPHDVAYAEAQIREAVGIWRQLRAEQPGRYGPMFWFTYRNGEGDDSGYGLVNSDFSARHGGVLLDAMRSAIG